MDEQLFEFKEKGFIHLKNVIKSEELEINRNLAIELKMKYAEFEGQPRENGSGYFWKGLEMVLDWFWLVSLCVLVGFGTRGFQHASLWRCIADDANLRLSKITKSTTRPAFQ